MSAPQIKLGDRVKMRDDADSAIATVVGHDETGDPVFYYEDQPSEWQCPLIEKLELVEVAHYAPPGVPMVAMTPERIKALESLSVLHATSAKYDDKTLYARNRDTIAGMLAETRGEVAA